MVLMKFLKHALLGITLSSLFWSGSAFAATTVLPSSNSVNETTEQGCIADLKNYNKGEELETSFKNGTTEDQDYILGCAVKSGYIKFWMVPYFIKYILTWIINLSGLLAVLMILVGAYFYIWGGISDEKEKGKKVILYAIGGLILTSVAWFIVNVVLLAITG